MKNKIHLKLLQRYYSEVDQCYKVTEILGSDGSQPLDNRLSLYNMKLQAFKTIKHLSRVKPQVIGFKIVDKNGMELEKIVFETREQLESSRYYND